MLDSALLAELQSRINDVDANADPYDYLCEFREFLSFFPTHPRADYAQFRLAMAHYQQMRAPQRESFSSRRSKPRSR